MVTEFEKMKSAKTLQISPDAPLMQEVFDVSTKKYAAGSAANGIKQTLFLLDQHAKTNESSFLRAAMPSAPREYAVRKVNIAAGVSGPGVCELYALPDLLIALLQACDSVAAVTSMFPVEASFASVAMMLARTTSSAGLKLVCLCLNLGTT